MDFDSTAQLLGMEISEKWEKSVQEANLQSKKNAEESLKANFGVADFEQKRQNIIDLGSKPVSIIAFHNQFFEQIRTAFIAGAYYPSLIGACALGERILNHLIIFLRADYVSTPEYKLIYSKDSFDNWDLSINTLQNWEVLLPEVVIEYKKLKTMRNNAVHFRPEVDTNDRRLALDAIRSLHNIIRNQFSAFGAQPWFITSIPGEIYLKKDWEGNPFINKIYLQNCAKVGPKHSVLEIFPWKITDETYPLVEITDEEFSRLRNHYKEGEK